MRASFVLLACLSSLLPAACGDDDDDDDAAPDGGEGEPDGGSGDDGGAEGDAGPLPESCAEPDTECPAVQPVPSGPCEAPLSCEYLDANGVDTWTYECAGGRWTADVECNLDGGCPVPPLAELCLDPFAETLEGATVELGSADVALPFATFEDGDDVDLVVGAQGGAMITFRLAVRGDDVPGCVGATMTVTADGVAAAPQTARIALHCGVSLPVFAILPTEYCEAATIPVELHVEVEGIGEADAIVEFTTQGKCVG